MGADISQRDLRLRSREIMDAVERGETFTVTRGGRGVGELVPMRRSRTFVPRSELDALWRGAPSIDADRFRGDVDASVDPGLGDAFDR